MILFRILVYVGLKTSMLEKTIASLHKTCYRLMPMRGRSLGVGTVIRGCWEDGRLVADILNEIDGNIKKVKNSPHRNV
jgi:hypothetical protein